MSRIVALAGAALLVDAAVETFWAASPVRWWAVGVAVLYAVITAATWRRELSAAWRSAIAVGSLLGLAAITAWRPDGLTNGLRLFGQSTARVDAAVAAAGIAAATYRILLARRIPAAARYALTTLGAYGLSAFAVGAAIGTPLTILLAGGSLWDRLPRLLQGAFVGGFVVLPIGLVAAAIATGLRRPWPSSARADVNRLIVIATSLAMLAAAVQPPIRTGASSAAVANWTPPAPAAGPMPAASDVTAQFDAIAKALKPEDYLIDALAPTLPTIEAAFAFVRDRIGFESYEGILRGGKGTLCSRAGNALDRAMLLAAILQKNNVPMRIAIGPLPRDLAERLFARIFEPPARQRSAPAERSALTARIFARAGRDYRTLTDALGSDLPAVSSPSHDDVIGEIERHAWVQAQRNGQWIDLDPSFPDSTVGRAYATSVSQTFDTPPAPLMQTVTIRVVAETLSGGTLRKDVALESTTPAYRLADAQIYLMHHRPPPPTGDTRAAPLQDIFGNVDVWQPALVVNGEVTDGKEIDFGAGASAAGSAPNAGQQVLSAFGAPETTTAATFVAEWLEFEVNLPGGRSDVTRRLLVDRAGAAWRRAAALDPKGLRDLPRIGKTLVAPQSVYNIWLSAGKHDLLGFAESAQAIAGGDFPGSDPSREAAVPELLWPFAIRDLSWLVASDHLLVPAVNDAPGVRFYADSPRIFVWGIGLDPSRPDGAFVESDLRRDRLRGIAEDAPGQASIAGHKLWFGALEGALEHEMGLPASADPASSLVTTSSLAEGGDVVRLGPGTGATPGAADPDTAARLQTALAGGDTLVVPKRVLAGGMPGWWQIDRNTGDVRSVLADLGGGFGKPTPGGFRKGPTHIKLPGLPRDGSFSAPRAASKSKGGEFAEYAANLRIAINSAGVWLYVVVGIVDAVVLVALAFEIIKEAT